MESIDAGSMRRVLLPRVSDLFFFGMLPCYILLVIISIPDGKQRSGCPRLQSSHAPLLVILYTWVRYCIGSEETFALQGCVLERATPCSI